MSRAKISEPGFTLIEMLAVMLLTAMVLTACVNFFRQLSQRSVRAAELTRNARRAVAVLDRVARDLEGSTLVRKPEAVDPLKHPWLFLAESEASPVGADRLKFMTRSHLPRTDDPAETDLQVVTWTASAGDAGDLVLRRSATNGLPEGLDRSFPDVDQQAVVARGVASFGVRLLDDAGEWQSDWDSSLIVKSSELPVAAEIEIAFLPPEGLSDAEPGEEPTPYVRRVALPVRPIDLEKLLNPDGKESDRKDEDAKDEDEDKQENAGLTVAECVAKSPALAAALAGVDPGVLQSLAGQPAAAVASSRGVPLPPECQ